MPVFFGLFVHGIESGGKVGFEKLEVLETGVDADEREKGIS